MHLLLLRHGIAEDHSHDGTDAARRLTEEGVRKTRKAVAGLASIIDPPQAILTSPKRRAHETAQLAAEQFSLPCETVDLLAAEQPRAIADMLRSRNKTSLILVGHEPTLSWLAELLCTGECRRGFVRLKKAGCICLDARLDGDGTQILWSATARMLRALG